MPTLSTIRKWPVSSATATWNDLNGDGTIHANELNHAGWEDKASSVYGALYSIRDELLANGLFGYAPMALFDDPAHDAGGYQYFMQNEYHLGITGTGAVGGVDHARHGDVTFKGSILDFLYAD